MCDMTKPLVHTSLFGEMTGMHYIFIMILLNHACEHQDYVCYVCFGIVATSYCIAGNFQRQ